MQTFREYLNEAARPGTVIARAISAQGSTNYMVTVNDQGLVLVKNTRGVNLHAGAIAFNVDGGKDEQVRRLKNATRGVKSSEELAKSLNDNRLGFTNWKPVLVEENEITDELLGESFVDSKGKTLQKNSWYRYSKGKIKVQVVALEGDKVKMKEEHSNDTFTVSRRTFDSKYKGYLTPL